MTEKNNDSFIENEFMDTETKDFFDNPDNRDDGLPVEDNPGRETKVYESRNEKNETTDDSAEDNNTDNETGNENDNHSHQKISDEERYRAMATEERERRKEIQKQIDTLNQENAKLKGTFDKIMQKAQEQAERDSQQNIPSFDENPLEALRYENEQLKQKMGKIDQNITQKEQAEIQNRQIQERQTQFVSLYKQKANEFRKEAPDFDAAYKYLLETRQEEHRLSGYDEGMVDQLLYEDEAAIVANALQQGINPASRLYQLAKLRGYKAGDNIKSGSRIDENNEKIANLERGLKASKSVNTGGSNSRDQLTLEDVADMSEDELEKVDWNRLMKLG